MQFSLPSALLLLLGLFQITLAQSTVTCDEYSSIANYSTIGRNATMRSAYLAASPEGSDPARKVMDDAIKKIDALTVDPALNAECGNLTTIALREAPNNFTQGIVAQFKVKGAGARIESTVGTIGLVVMMVGFGTFL